MGMGHEVSWEERRSAMRVPVRGVAVLHANTGPVRGRVENLSRTGALFNVPSEPLDLDEELELELDDARGWVGVRPVRIVSAHPREGFWVAVAFERIDPAMRASIELSIETAVMAARRKPILVIDDDLARRTRLIDRLVDRGMTPVAPRTPLDTIDLLTRSQLQISLCLLAPGFGVPATDLVTVLAESFPWVTTSDISDDLDRTIELALEAWSNTSVARFGLALA